MTQRICPRCHTVLQVEDEGTLFFCSNCGAPQVRLSEELLTQAEQQQAGFAQSVLQQSLDNEPAPSATPPPDPTVIYWKRLIRIAAVVAAFFALPTMFLPPLALLIPAIVLALYAARSRQVQITTGLGARIGLLCGLFLAVAVSIAGTVSMLFLRFKSQDMAAIDNNLTDQIVLRKAQIVAEQGQAAGQMFAQFATIPEFRAGLLLAGFACLMAVLAALCIAGGAFAGFVRARATTR